MVGIILVVGGAYQGKLDYVLSGHPGKSVFGCDLETTEIDLSADIINSLHLMILAQIRSEIDSLAFLRDRMEKLRGKIVICDDISCGVVPVDAETRQWRESTGRCLALLSKNADEVIRVFCGIATRIKW